MRNNDYIILNQIKYEYNIILSNQDGAIILPKLLFRELCITESFNDWNTIGYLIYDNTFEQLERYKKDAKVKNREFFYFRMDGTDEISIELTPIFEPKTNKELKTEKEFPIDIISFKFRGSIYDSEDLSKNNIEKKLKKIYFWDYYYNRAINTNARVSSGEYLKLNGELNIGNMNNSTRFVRNGDLIKYICENKLGANVSDDWDSGDRTTFYVSSPMTNLYDDITYLMDKYYENEGFPGYFTYDRYNQEFKLKSYRNIFLNYKNELKEKFRFSDPTDPNKKIHPPRSDKNNIFWIPTFGDILSYKYAKMSGSDSIRNINSIISYQRDLDTKEFIVNRKIGHIQKIKNIYSSMLQNFQSGNNNPLFIINKDKIDNRNAKEIVTNEPTSVLKDVLKPALLLNDALQFHVLGLPNRQPGKFIEIESDTDTEGIWEDRFLGTWMAMQVKHKITNNSYENTILAVKPNMSNSFSYPDGTES